ncbi:hypothetical protein [Lactiplantibacillus fabifermentans]|uniref:Uncharacterized protein n=2 Tax=Lactiplantibacillus fabifermentans TaxID=483011 RepID=A0A0R2NCD4_9LACO|nr:hypothetical protein [Lactiplantibacillus fabifermentans]ETY75293.1 hypothetical protein LFAB_02580 [Lactiplantibacillus fabifermentans T30PCM01]KRO22482.1 hypothetical protein DY78_GL002000 [Lactiplantibacillus fabifermentans DSM 21115]
MRFILIPATLAGLLGILVGQYGITSLIRRLVLGIHGDKYLATWAERIWHRRVSRAVLIGLAVIILGLGTGQATQFYLFNGAYFWVAILSAGLYGLLFILPWLTLLLGYRHSYNLVGLLAVNLGTGTVAVWIGLLLTAGNKLFDDEGGVSYHMANVPLKKVTIGLLVGYYVVALLGLVVVSNQYWAQRRAAQPAKLQVVGQHRPGRLTPAHTALVVASGPLIFIAAMQLVDNIIGASMFKLLTSILFIPATLTLVISLISWGFLRSSRQGVRVVSLISYTILSIINLLGTYLFTASGWSRFAGDTSGHLGVLLRLNALPIMQVGLWLLTVFAWLVPYWLFYRRQHASKNAE